ncbi:hypothetical protein AQ505_11220 [Pedobacter sp. PACM 27299]|uniref:hypothetical protein n=1 Tax=Pedobacter sp. PACM 27299 TaxID=1727164 RepID=UPI0007056C75|nr:hypothetical protein [Pedobacter sp. PACM 27299]ALL06011.1 hypothetical protein AQ505_11220 [Pedobacter sp. PACM 27299]
MRNGQTEVYVCFKSANGELISDSAYVGNLNGLAESNKEQVEKKHYMVVKVRFDRVEADYHQKIIAHKEGRIGTKAFRHIAKEYEMLKQKLKSLPGKPS